MRLTPSGSARLRWLAVGLLLGCLSATAHGQTAITLTPDGPPLAPTIPNATCVAWVNDSLVVGDLQGKLQRFDKNAQGYQLSLPFLELARHVTFSDRNDALLTLAVSPDKTSVVTGGIGQTARVWSLASLPTYKLPVSGAVVALANNSTDTWATAAVANNVWVLNQTQNPDGTFPVPLQLGAVVDNANTAIPVDSIHWRKLDPQDLPLAGLNDGSIAVWPSINAGHVPSRVEPPSTGSPAAVWSVPSNGQAGAVNPETFVSIGNDSVLRTWDPTNVDAPKIQAPSFPANGVAFALSDDGSSLAVAADKAITVWSGWTAVTNPIVLQSTAAGPGSTVATINLVAIDQDGQNVAAADASGQLWLYDISTGAPPVKVDTLTAPTPPPPAPPVPATPPTPRAPPLQMACLALSADAGLLAAASSNTIWVYNTTAMVPSAAPLQTTNPVKCLAFLKVNGVPWLVGAAGSQLSFWNVNDLSAIPMPTSLSLPQGVAGAISALDLVGDWSGAAAADGTFKWLVAGTTDGFLLVSQLPLDATPWAGTGWPSTVLNWKSPGGSIGAVHMQDTTKRMVSIADDSKVRVWDFADTASSTAVQLLQREVLSPPGKPSLVWLLNSGKTVLSVAALQQPQLSQIAALGATTIPDAPATTDPKRRWIALGPQAAYLLFTAGDDRESFDGGVFSRKDDGTYARLTLESPPKNLTTTTLTSDQQHIIIGSNDGTIRSWTTASTSMPLKLETTLAPSPNSGVKSLVATFHALVVTSFDNNSCFAIDFSDPAQAVPSSVKNLGLGAGTTLSAMVFVKASVSLLGGTTDGRVLSSRIGALSVYGRQRLSQLNPTTGPAPPPNPPASPPALPGKHRGPVYALAFVPFDPTTPRLATAAADGLVRIWQLPPSVNSNPTVQFPHSVAESQYSQLRLNDAIGTAVYGLAFNGQNAVKQLLATAGADGRVKFWDLSTPDVPIATDPAGQAPASAVRCLAGSTDGASIAVGREDGTITRYAFASQAPQPLGKLDNAVVSIAFHPTNPNVLALTDDQNNLVFWDCTAGKSIPIQTKACAFAWNQPAGSKIVTITPTGAIQVFNVTGL